MPETPGDAPVVGLADGARGSVLHRQSHFDDMKCFNHPEADAVAICKSCNRGLCHQCMVEVGKSSSCKNRCEADVTMLNELVERGRTAYQKSSNTLFRTGLFTLLLGAVFLLIGLLMSDASGAKYFIIVMGLLFVGWGISYFVSARRLRQK